MQALAWERDREAQIRAQMAKPIVVTPPCAACGTPSARIELVAPGHLPAEWEQWPSTVQDSIMRQREPGQWYLLFKGVAAYNGYGSPIDASRARRIARFPGYAQVRRVHATLSPWTVQEGLITATLKLRRKELLERFAQEVEALYAGH